MIYVASNASQIDATLLIFMGVLIVVLVAALYYATCHLSRRLDRQLLGICVRKLGPYGETVTLNFREPKLASEVRQHTAERMLSQIDRAQRMLRENPPS